MLVSVIVPVFNLGEFLDRTLKNFIQQLTMLPQGQWELIIVDDGSTDNSEQIIAPLSSSYPASIIVLRTTNRGVSAARNSGMSLASGTYIMFADGDDLLSPGMFAPLIQYAKKYTPDLIHFGYNTITTKEYLKLSPVTPNRVNGSNVEVIDSISFLNKTQGMIGPPIEWNIWQNLFKREFLINSNIRFAEDLSIGEDNILMWSVLLQHPNMVWCKQPLYLYHLRATSTIHCAEISHIKRMAYARIRYVDYLQQINERLISDKVYTQALYGLKIEMKNVFYKALSDLLICGLPLTESIKLLNKYKHNGGEIRIGRPRLNYHYDIKYDPEITMRRWILAYPVSSILRLK